MAPKQDWSNKQRLLPIASVLSPGAGQTEIRDISSEYWFGPLQPVHPTAPSSYRPRQYAYDPGSNIIWQPKADSPITFATLRALADSWDLLRLVIETRKDQLCRLKGEIRVRREPGEKNSDQKQRNLKDPTVQELNRFLQSPDGFHPFHKWLRLWLEDMLVIDAVSLYLERDKQGRIARVIPIAGDTVNRMLTDQGITPPPPSIAYQQVVYGTPVCNFTTDDLIYSMRNERTFKRYGYSRVEQILITISIGLRRQEFQLQYYTSSNVPEAMAFLPNEWPIEKVKEIQMWFDSILAGDLAQRRRLLFMPGLGSGDKAGPSVVFTKEKLLQDSMDEWLARLVCFNFGISPQALQKMMNRASAQQASDDAAEEGLEPDKREVESVMNQVVHALGYSDRYEWVWQDSRETDILKQAQADKIYVSSGVNTINEIREAKGDDPRDEANADRLGILTQQGFIPIDPKPGEPGNPEDKIAQQESQQRAQELQAQRPVVAGQPGQDGKPPVNGKPPQLAGKQPANGNGKQPAPGTPAKKGRTIVVACEKHKASYPRTWCKACAEADLAYLEQQVLETV